MAKKKGPIQNTSSVETRSFTKGMNKDINESLLPEGSYVHARNAVNNSTDGNLGVLSNESSNKLCASAPYTVIGVIHLYAEIWAVFSTDNTNSEIGTFNEELCEYKTVANDPCLNFKTEFPIIGEAKELFDCTWNVYWADSNNPDRYINIQNPPWIQIEDVNNPNEDCVVLIDTDELNCEALRMARLTKSPKIRLEQGPNGGETLNGTYQAVIAYSENEQRVTDYSLPTNVVSLFDNRNVNGSLELIIDDIDTSYDEFELVIIGFVNQQTVAKRVGIYSTRNNRISIDRINPTSPTVPLEFIPLDTPSYEKSEGLYRNGEYLIRVAPTSRFSFNYQPLANQIETKWVSVRYPLDYYRKDGRNISYMRDEVYSFFIRWVYNTMDKSESYHIPGRAPGIYPQLGIQETDTVSSPAYGTGYVFEEYNTATSSLISGTLPDGGELFAEGLMGYWESSEKYPDNNFEVWEDLCGKNIRHHRMPDSSVDSHFDQTTGDIKVLGVKFSNIKRPIDNQGNLIPGIVGYEILRGSREGNKTVVAKGMFNNMGTYRREDNNELAYYQNYPYNDLREDPFLSRNWVNGDNETNQPYGGSFYSRNRFTFHSPDTQFKHPFLSAKEMKIEETQYGTPEGWFVDPYLHPEHKIISDFTFIVSALVGFGIALNAVKGEQKTRVQSANVPDSQWAVAGTTNGTNFGIIPAIGAAGTHNILITADAVSQFTGAEDFASVFGTTGQTEPSNSSMYASALTASTIPGVNSIVSIEYDPVGGAGLPGLLRVIQGVPTFLAYWGEGTDSMLNLIKAFSKYHQYATAYQSHCFFHKHNYTYSNFRTGILDSSYISDRIQEFGSTTVNNLFRNSHVALYSNSNVPDPDITDVSRVTMSQQFGNTNADNISVLFNTGYASAHYGSLKQRLRNQYGQIDSIIQIPTSSYIKEWEVDPANPGGATSDVIFGGDIYIGRYTEKNTMFYFSDWMYDLPNDFEYDYRLRKMMPYPTYWMDTKDFQINDFFAGIFNVFNSQSGNAPFPSGFHNFDRGNFLSGQGGLLPNLIAAFSTPMVVKNAYMYLFNSGVRDFIVESEVNIEYRDWENENDKRHFDPYGFDDLYGLFRTDIIKSGNFYKYDYSLSVSRYYQSYPTWGSTQRRNYNPEIAETCYTYYKNRLIYSLPQTRELRKDNWLVYLVDNYRDFTSKVVNIKSIGKNGAMMLFEDEAPIQFAGVDTLQTDSGTKITLGDGGLFNQALQNLVNTDPSYEYGSCQNRLSVINTPAGLFWISQNQGKIFNYAGGIKEISNVGMKWWFAEFLPYKLTEDFPEFELIDNSIIGISCQSIYDNQDGVVYFSKRDFKLKEEFKDTLEYIGGNLFKNESSIIELGDKTYFEDACWTISYDPKNQSWISFHDWKPNLMMPSKTHFLTIKNNTIWRHNQRDDSYCNFYNENYPFEVELVLPTGQNVNTLKSVEYLMEVYNYSNNGIDRHHVLDLNFDRAILYNTEQISGMLNLNISPKNNVNEILNYPIINPNSIDILYSKEEQKYRFNQFWDIVDDRGEFSNARRPLWSTEPNGYIKSINPNAVNYNKNEFQRKKFRHYQTNLWLQKRISGNNNMNIKLVNSKNQYSLR